MKKYIITIVLSFAFVFSVVKAQTYTFLYDMSVGSTGVQVANLQTWLIDHGFNIPAITSGLAYKGYFGAQTKAAVMRYQASVGVPNTGYVGPLTRGRINASFFNTT